MTCLWFLYFENSWSEIDRLLRSFLLDHCIAHEGLPLNIFLSINIEMFNYGVLTLIKFWQFFKMNFTTRKEMGVFSFGWKNSFVSIFVIHYLAAWISWEMNYSWKFSWLFFLSFVEWDLGKLSHCPKLKMNGKKPSKWQFHFPGLLEAVLKLEKWKTKWGQRRSREIEFWYFDCV